MACGIPVIYANTSSLSELLGNAAVAVDPASAVSLANGIYELLQNEQLRLSLSKNGIEHIQRYSWENVALNVLNIYEQLAKNSVEE
jgi:glycosyltransferase involved in cell wall biosynthesis